MAAQTPIDYLDVYLDDHRAVAVAGLELGRRMRENRGGTDRADDLMWLVDQLAADLHTLEEVRTHLDIGGGYVKSALAFVGEKLGRLKLNGHLVTSSPLSPVVETETLAAIVTAKRQLWSALGTGIVETVGFDFDHLAKRADEQLDLIAELHADAVLGAFAA